MPKEEVGADRGMMRNAGAEAKVDKTFFSRSSLFFLEMEPMATGAAEL